MNKQSVVKEPAPESMKAVSSSLSPKPSLWEIIPEQQLSQPSHFGKTRDTIFAQQHSPYDSQISCFGKRLKEPSCYRYSKYTIQLLLRLGQIRRSRFTGSMQQNSRYQETKIIAIFLIQLQVNIKWQFLKVLHNIPPTVKTKNTQAMSHISILLWQARKAFSFVDALKPLTAQWTRDCS